MVYREGWYIEKDGIQRRIVLVKKRVHKEGWYKEQDDS